MATRQLFAALFVGVFLASIGEAPASAQSRSIKEVQVADLRTMKDKFVSLGEAFPIETYDWRPMEGVRSVKDVLVLITTEGNGFPTQWGAPLPMGVNEDRGAERARLEGLSKDELIAELGGAFDNIIAVVEGMDDDARMRELRFFGQEVRIDGAIAMVAGDMHEHLGQLIAYARTNRIVPPWSR